MIICVPRLKLAPQIDILQTDKRIPWSGHMARHALQALYEAIVDARMSVVFVNTRAQAEFVFQNLWRLNDRNLRIAVHHGSLERDLRRKVEARMAAGGLDCVVATSSLDLGLDWADVDLVIQVGAPKGVSRLPQRVGRANHRLDEPSRAILVPTNRFEYLECVAAQAEIAANNLDGAVFRRGGYDVLAQHIFGVACSGPFFADALFPRLSPLRHTPIWRALNLMRSLTLSPTAVMFSKPIPNTSALPHLRMAVSCCAIENGAAIPHEYRHHCRITDDEGETSAIVILAALKKTLL